MFQACAQKVSKTPIFKEVIDVLVIPAVYYSLILQVTTTPQNFEFKLLQKESSKWNNFFTGNADFDYLSALQKRTSNDYYIS